MTSRPTRPPVVVTRERHLTRRGVLWLGLRCDVRCKFCYDERVPAGDKAWLKAEDAVKALDKFRFYYGNEFVDFMGGEPTLHPAVLDIVAHADPATSIPGTSDKLRGGDPCESAAFSHPAFRRTFRV